MKATANKFTFAIAAGLCAVLCGCGTAKVSNRHEITTATVARPAMIYIADFDLAAASIKSDTGAVAVLPKPLGQPGDILPPPPGPPRDPQKVARELVHELGASIVKNLTKAGLPARRLQTGEPPPTDGWLVRGVFTDVNQGNQLRRAVIGFGAGRTDLQVCLDISDLTQDAPKRFYKLNTAADSGKGPGAAPMIAFCPAGAAARFVIAGKDLSRNAKQTASQIATEIVERVKRTGESQLTALAKPHHVP